VNVSDRKYRHNGYQDSGQRSKQPSEGPRPNTGPFKERMEGAPRGRTAGGFGPEAFKCNQCGTLRHSIGDLTNEDTCVKCGADLHTCGNCRNFDTTTMWECRETIPARISAKHAKNECAKFSPKIVRDLSPDKGSQQYQSPDDARKAFDALFNKK
jgi:hypothetical protein